MRVRKGVKLPEPAEVHGDGQSPGALRWLFDHIEFLFDQISSDRQVRAARERERHPKERQRAKAKSAKFQKRTKTLKMLKSSMKL